jgi:hypothetical protein
MTKRKVHPKPPREQQVRQIESFMQGHWARYIASEPTVIIGACPPDDDDKELNG